ncbi:MAG TPA: prepilin-type N-terminal cleavage/methylation domain-containing protein [Candidatus Udaeobacter sp.]|jgi:prepilin-type N-terminal cleavage/methylation domain-containing protein
MAKNLHFARAFTMIELLVIMAIIAVLVSIAYPVYTGIIERGKATKDLSNLRQIGIAAQAYMNDSDGTLFLTSSSWMLQLESNQKYLSAWGVLESPFDRRSPSEIGANATPNLASPISYGINPNSVGIAVSIISKPTIFVLFAPAGAAGPDVSFLGRATDVPGGTVLGNGNGTATTKPNNQTVTGGTQNTRTRINALFADLHSETMPWSTFTNSASTANDPDGQYRWNPSPTPAPPP